MKIVSIIDDKSVINYITKEVGLDKFKNLKNALNEGLNYIQDNWKSRIVSCSAKEGWKRKYIETFYKTITENDNNSIGEVGAGGMYANFIEEGIKSYDMKIGMLNGRQARINKKTGERYLIIFLQKFLKELPPDVRKSARKLDYNEVLKGFDEIGQRSKYNEGFEKSTWGGGLYKGFTKTRMKGQTQYGTFRVVTKNSQGWIYPNISGHRIFQSLDNLFPEVMRMMKDAFLEDLSIVKKG